MSNARNFNESFLSSQSRPHLLYISLVTGNPDWKYPKHIHCNSGEIAFCISGEGNFIIDDRIYPIIKGDIVVLNSGTSHEEYSLPSSPFKMYSIGVSCIALRGLGRDLIIPKECTPVIHTGSYFDKVEKYISEMLDELSSQKDGFDTICENNLLSLLVLIHRIIESRCADNQTSAHSALVEKVREYVDQNYFKDLTLQRISDLFYVNPYYLAHIFKKDMGDSPINYLIKTRLNTARNLLLSTDLSIKEIAFLTGYDNPLYFSVAFKKLFGTSPIKLRKNGK